MRPVVRHSATAVAALALALLAIRPERSVTIHPADALLVTPGASTARVRRLADSLGTTRVLALTGADSLPDAGYVARHFLGGDASRLHVAGWGLREDDWNALGTAPASVHPEPPPAGFVTASWPHTLALGDELRVTGAVAGRCGLTPYPPLRACGEGGRWVYLGDPSGPLDSAQTNADGSFTLTTRPRAEGRQLYALSAAGVPAETLGVVVLPPPRWHTLILTAAPSFEAAALRDLLATRGAPVVWRAGMSRDRERTELVNRGAAPLAKLRARDLASIDLLLIDGRSLLALGVPERMAVLRAVRDSGLGMLLLPDASLQTAAASLGFALRPDTALTERLVRPHAAGERPPATAVPAEPFTLRETFAMRTVLWGAGGELLAQVNPAGAGRIGLTLVTAASRWIRAGERGAFAAYWAPLLAAVAGTSADARWTLSAPKDGPALVHQPHTVAVRGGGPHKVAIVTGAGGAYDTVFLAPDAVEAGRWLGRYWPRHAGWYEVRGADGAAVHVAAATAWQAQQAADRLAATARWTAAAPTAGAERPPQTVRRPLPLGWWLALFVLAAGVLWAERRRAYIRAMPRTAVAALLLAITWGCAKSEEDRRAEVTRCSAVNTQADLISLCLVTEHKWKDAPADSAGRQEAHRIDSLRTAQDDALWNSESARHNAELKTCSATSDVQECLLVRAGWPSARAARASDSIWTRNADRHAREVRSCARAQGPIASCLMLNYKWNARLALATEDSVRRARMR